MCIFHTFLLNLVVMATLFALLKNLMGYFNSRTTKTQQFVVSVFLAQN